MRRFGEARDTNRVPFLQMGFLFFPEDRYKILLQEKKPNNNNDDVLKKKMADMDREKEVGPDEIIRMELLFKRPAAATRLRTTARLD